MACMYMLLLAFLVSVFNVSIPEGTRIGLKALGHDISIIFGTANYYANYPVKNAGDRPDGLSFFALFL